MSRCLFTELDEPLPATITSLNLGYQCSTRSLESITLQTWGIGDATSEIALGSIISYDHAAQDFNAHPTLQLLTASGNNYAGRMVYDGEAYRYSLSGDYTYAQGTVFVVQPIEERRPTPDSAPNSTGPRAMPTPMVSSMCSTRNRHSTIS